MSFHKPASTVDMAIYQSIANKYHQSTGRQTVNFEEWLIKHRKALELLSDDERALLREAYEMGVDHGIAMEYSKTGLV